MHKPHRRSRGAFSLIEALIVMALIAIIAVIGFPALQHTIARVRLDGAIRELGSQLRNARMEALKRSRPVTLRVDTALRDVVMFVDNNGDGAIDAGEIELQRYQLHPLTTFGAPGVQPLIDGFATSGNAGWATITPTGSATASGAFRLTDPRQNYVEVRMSPRATAKIILRKYDPALNDWFQAGEGSGAWKWN